MSEQMHVARPLEPQSKRTEALQEYYVVQEAIGKFDDRSFQIKSWSITLIAAAVAGGLAQDQPALYALAAVASFGFWLVDALWKSFQEVWLKRGAQIEKMLSADSLDDYSGPAIHSSFHGRFKSRISWFYVLPCMFKANVYLYHIPVSVGLLVFYWWSIGRPGLDVILSGGGAG